ncbi:unnamed protein product [Rotaria socialis]
MVHSNEYTIDENIDHEHNISQCHPRLTTLKEIREILDKHPCIQFENYNQNQNQNRRQKRWLSGGDETKNHINAIYGKITEHHDMINVLTNSSINTTIMLNTIRDHHAYTLPNLSSWRDLTQVFLVIIILLTFMYFLFCRSNVKLGQKLLLCITKKKTYHSQEQQQQLQELMQKQQQQLNRLEQQFDEFKARDLANQRTIHRRRHIYPSVPSVNSDTAHHNDGYMSE